MFVVLAICLTVAIAAPQFYPGLGGSYGGFPVSGIGFPGASYGGFPGGAYGGYQGGYDGGHHHHHHHGHHHY